jgi:hypothetical protein
MKTDAAQKAQKFPGVTYEMKAARRERKKPLNSLEFDIVEACFPLCSQGLRPF